MVVSLVLQASGLGLLLVAQTVIARAIGVHGFGTYSYAVACATTAVTFAKFGTDTLVFRFGGQYSAHANWALFKGLLNRSRRLISLASIAACAALLIFAMILFFKKRDITLSIAVVLAAAAVPLVAFSALRQVSLVAINWVIRGLAPEYLLRPLVLIAVVASLWQMGLAGAPAVVAAYVGSYAASFAVGQFWIQRSQITRDEQPPDHRDAKQWFEAARSLMLFSIAYQVLSQYDLLIAGYFLDSRSVGAYAAAKQFATVGLLGLIAFQFVLSPRLASAHFQDDKAEFDKLTRAANIGGVCFTVVYGAVMLVCGQLVLGFFGAEFRDGYAPLVWLVLAQLVNAISGPAGSVAAMLGLQRSATWIYISAFALGSMLIRALLPRFGIEGVAVSVFLVTGFWCVALNILLHRKAGGAVWIGRSFRATESAKS